MKQTRYTYDRKSRNGTEDRQPYKGLKRGKKSFFRCLQNTGRDTAIIMREGRTRWLGGGSRREDRR